MSSLLRTACMRFAIVALSLVVGCGGASHAAAPPRVDPSEDGGLQLTLRRHDGEVIELSDQRGAPVLLFFFATYDGASTASSRDLARFARDALDTVVIAVALQANAPTFTAAYVESEAPPYTVAYDGDDVIVRGRSELGSFEAIPMFVMIDAHGREIERHVGYASARQLQRWREEALSRGGLTPRPDESAGADRRRREREIPPETPPPSAEDDGEPPVLEQGDVVIEPPS